MSKQILVMISSFLLPIFGFLLGFFAAFYFDEQPLFFSWKPLESSVKFKEINDAFVELVWATGEDGKTYLQDLHCNELSFKLPKLPKCMGWFETTTSPDIPHIYITDDCSFPKQFSWGLPDTIQQCAYANPMGSNRSAVYVLDADGKVWVYTTAIHPLLESLLRLGLMFVGTALGIMSQLYVQKFYFKKD